MEHALAMTTGQDKQAEVTKALRKRGKDLSLDACDDAYDEAADSGGQDATGRASAHAAHAQATPRRVPQGSLSLYPPLAFSLIFACSSSVF
jgi:hypothetical protein